MYRRDFALVSKPGILPDPKHDDWVSRLRASNQLLSHKREYTATVFERAIKEQMALDTIEVERSPVCQPDSDCWEVKLIFFDPHRQLDVARWVNRYTDISDVVPVLVGDDRQWSIR